MSTQEPRTLDPYTLFWVGAFLEVIAVVVASGVFLFGYYQVGQMDADMGSGGFLLAASALTAGAVGALPVLIGLGLLGLAWALGRFRPETRNPH